MTERVPPIRVDADAPERLGAERVVVPDDMRAALRDALGADRVLDDAPTRTDAARDWWPISVVWAHHGLVPARPDCVVRPRTLDDVVSVLVLANRYRVPVTTAAGRSGVLGGAVPVAGGLVLDVAELAAEPTPTIDTESMVATVAASWWGDELEAELARNGVTAGHWPQSMDISTVGGWLACRGAGQLSTRYGKIEDMVVGVECVTGAGDVLRVEHAPRQATGPDLVEQIVGSEGALAVITRATLRVHPKPDYEAARAWRFDSFAAGLDAVRRALQRGATPAVVRLYDGDEAARSYEVDGAVLLLLDEGDRAIVDAALTVADAEAARTGTPLDAGLVERWRAHRNDVSLLEIAIQGGLVADTIEVSARWHVLERLHTAVVAGLKALDGTLIASAHCSHAYPDGGCLYFTFAGQVGDDLDAKERYYRAAWDTAMAAVLGAGPGAAVSHHHGIGKHRGAAMRAEIGEVAWNLLVAQKRAFDPNGILNPGTFGLPSPFLPDGWAWR